MAENLSIKQSPQRFYNLDWLRVLVILNLVPFHAAWLMTFVPGFSHINPDGWFIPVLKIYVVFFSPWHMPLLFLISGISSSLILGGKPPGDFLKERVFRLLIPLLFFMLFLYPVVAYFWPEDRARSFGDYFINFWPSCLETIFYNESTGGPRWAHMWFVAYLFIYSIILLPLYFYLKSPIGKSFTVKLFEVLNKRILFLLCGLLFGLVFALLSVPFPFFQNNLYSDWGYFTYNLVAFFLGYIFSVNRAFWIVVEKYWLTLLILGVICSGMVILMIIRFPSFSLAGYNPRYFLFSIVTGLNTWIWILALLGLSRVFLNKNTKFLIYFKTASYPFYIIHYPLMIASGFYLIELRLGAIGEFMLFTLISYIITLLLYMLASRIPWLRIVFGIKYKFRFH